MVNKKKVRANGLEWDMDGLTEGTILYVCDRRACQCCNPACNYTADIRHAKNFKLEGKVFTDG